MYTSLREICPNLIKIFVYNLFASSFQTARKVKSSTTLLSFKLIRIFLQNTDHIIQIS